MKIRILSLLAVLVCFVSAHSQTVRGKRTAPRTAVKAFVASNVVNDLPIRRVILYSNGVAYIERRGFVTGNAEIHLSFKQSQVDDILKSMVVLDLNDGKIGAVSYNSSMPASARTAEIPFDVLSKSKDSDEEARSNASVLMQIKGDNVIVNSN